MGSPFPPTPCAGTQPTLPGNCACPDPGVVQTGQNVIVSDSNTCPRRLLPVYDGSGNVVSGVVAVIGSGSVAIVQVTNQPEVLYPQLNIAANESFGQLIIASGANGLHYRVNPPGAANLFLQTDGAGAIEFNGPPAATVPDPLTIGTINVDTLLNVPGNITFAGTITGSVAAGTLITLLGLNSSNQIVSGNPATGISKAIFLDEPTGYLGQSFPNLSIANNQLAQIAGSQPYATDAIAIITSAQTIEVTATGTYQVDWIGCFGASTTMGGFTPGLQLIRNSGNSALIAYGMQGAVANFQSAAPAYTGTPVSGTWIGVLNSGDFLQIKAVAPSYSGGIPNVISSPLNLRNVIVTLTKFH